MHGIALSCARALTLAICLGALSPALSLAQDAGVTEDVAVEPSSRADGPPELADGIDADAAESAYPVYEKDLREDHARSADLPELLARTPGIAVLRSGALGSSLTYHLHGFYGYQVALLLDGVPLELLGYSLDVLNVPVNFIDRIDVYRGVVPIGFGTDALGGVLNLVGKRGYRTRAGASYQFGSYGTHRATLEGEYRHDPSGFVARGATFLDVSSNDYEVEVEIPDARGQLMTTSVPRFHDDYRAFGMTLEAGVVDRPWAKRLLLTGVVTDFDKELQHNARMTVPYGEVEYGSTIYGLTGRYDVALAPAVSLELVVSYAHLRSDFLDVAEWVYDWMGERARQRPIRGEVGSLPSDRALWQNLVFSRAVASWQLAPEHALRLSIAPQLASGSGEERALPADAVRDPLAVELSTFQIVSGLEYELRLWSGRLVNSVFLKDYFYQANGESIDFDTSSLVPVESDHHALGWGDALRLRFTSWLEVKLSYEYATRLPRSSEVIGDGYLMRPNAELEPEVSHNVNLGPRFDWDGTPIGDLVLDVNALWRDSDNLIVVVGGDRTARAMNLGHNRTLGVESAAAWTSPGRFVTLGGTLTYLDLRNVAEERPLSDFEGERIPNQPYCFANWFARLRLSGVPDTRDLLELSYDARFVEGYTVGFESAGIAEFQLRVDSQITHNLGLTWSLDRDFGKTSLSLEITNLADAQVYDRFGVQRPGRAFYAKLTAEI